MAFLHPADGPEVPKRLLEPAPVGVFALARGARAVVLGCTEIPLGIGAGPALPFPVADTIDALARAAIAWAKPAG